MTEREPEFTSLNKNVSRRDLLKGTILLAGGAYLLEACRSDQKIPEFSSQPLNLYPQLAEGFSPPNRFFWEDLTSANNRFNTPDLTITWSDNSVVQYSISTGGETVISASEKEGDIQIHMMLVKKYHDEGIIWEDGIHIIKDNGDEFVLLEAMTNKSIGRLRPSELIFRSKDEVKEYGLPITISDEGHVFFAMNTAFKMPIFVLNKRKNLLRIENLDIVGQIKQMAVVNDVLFVRTFRLDSFRTGAGPNQIDIGYVGMDRMFAYGITD